MYQAVHRTLLACVLVAAVAVAGCGRGDDDGGGSDGAQAQGVTDSEIRIAGSFPFSGPVAVYGAGSKGLEAYFAKVNADGGVDGRTISYTGVDDAYEPARAVSNARRFIDRDKVFAMVTFGTPSVTIAPIAAQGKTVQLAFAGNSPLSDTEKQPYTRAWLPNNNNEAQVVTQRILADDPDARIGTLVVNNDAGLDYVEGVKTALEGQTEAKLVKETLYEPTDVTVSSQVNQLRSADVDAVISLALGAAPIQMVRYIDQLGWNPVVALNESSTGLKSTVSKMGKAGEGLRAAHYMKDPMDPQWDDDAAMKEYKAVIAEHGDGVDPEDGNAIKGYALGEAIVTVLDSLDDPTQDAFIERWDSLPSTQLGVLQVPLAGGEGGRLIHEFQPVALSGENWEAAGELTRAGSDER